MSEDVYLRQPDNSYPPLMTRLLSLVIFISLEFTFKLSYNGKLKNE